jgi:hypothetical protein
MEYSPSTYFTSFTSPSTSNLVSTAAPLSLGLVSTETGDKYSKTSSAQPHLSLGLASTETEDKYSKTCA